MPNIVATFALQFSQWKKQKQIRVIGLTSC